MKIKDYRGKLRTLWHLTSRKNFTPHARSIPREYLGGRAERTPSLYATTNPYFWITVIKWCDRRRWAAEIDLLPGHPRVEREDPILHETCVDPRLIRVRRVVPLSQAVQEMKLTQEEIFNFGVERILREATNPEICAKSPRKRR